MCWSIALAAAWRSCFCAVDAGAIRLGSERWMKRFARMKKMDVLVSRETTPIGGSTADMTSVSLMSYSVSSRIKDFSAASHDVWTLIYEESSIC